SGDELPLPIHANRKHLHRTDIQDIRLPHVKGKRDSPQVSPTPDLDRRLMDSRFKTIRKDGDLQGGLLTTGEFTGLFREAHPCGQRALALGGPRERKPSAILDDEARAPELT